MTEIEDISAMLDEKWKERLAAAITASGKSKRAISLAAGMGPGYVHSILSEGKDPTIENLMKICAEIGVALSYITQGYEMTAADEEILRLLSQSSEDEKIAVLALLRSRNAGKSQ